MGAWTSGLELAEHIHKKAIHKWDGEGVDLLVHRQLRFFYVCYIE